MKKILMSVGLMATMMMTAQAQGLSQQVNHGPRLGLVWMFALDGDSSRLRTSDFYGDEVDLNGISSLFGYHVDYLIEADADLRPIIQVNTLAVGLEKMVFIPSLSSAFGVRHIRGFESGAGPGIFGDGTGVVFALGYNFEMGNVSYPVTLAYGVAGKVGKISLTTGFNIPK